MAVVNNYCFQLATLSVILLLVGLHFISFPCSVKFTDLSVILSSV